jgi:hypothetical protein
MLGVFLPRLQQKSYLLLEVTFTTIVALHALAWALAVHQHLHLHLLSDLLSVQFPVAQAAQLGMVGSLAMVCKQQGVLGICLKRVPIARIRAEPEISYILGHILETALSRPTYWAMSQQ